MNNIEQKKIRAWNSPVWRMPYGDAGHVQYEYDEDNDARVDAQSFNNLLQQLVDNDIYVENRLNAVSEYHAGPKSSTETAVAAGYDGYKFWGYSQNGDPIVYMKKELPLSDILSAVYSQPDDISCENIFEFAGVYYACTGSRLLSSSTGYSGWAQAFDDGRYWAVAQSNGTTVVMRGDSACLLYTERVGDRETVRLTALRRFENPTAVALRSDGRLFVASGRRLSSMTLVNTEVHDVVFECSVDADINGISFTDDEKTIVLATSKGVYRSDRINSLAGLDVIDAKAHVNTIVATEDSVYFATDDGLRTGTACLPVDGTEGCEIKHAVSDAGELYYCSSSGGKTGVFKLGSTDPVYGISEPVKWFGWYKDGVLFVETGSDLAYYTSSGKRYDVLPHSGGDQKLLLTRQNALGRAALYHASQAGNDVILSSFDVVGTEYRRDTSNAKSDKIPVAKGDNVIESPVAAVLTVGDNTFAVSKNGSIYDTANLGWICQVQSQNIEVVKAVAGNGRMFIASESAVYCVKIDRNKNSNIIINAYTAQAGSKVLSIQYVTDVLVVTTTAGFDVVYDDDNRPKVQHTQATGITDAVFHDNAVYALKNDGKVVKYILESLAFSPFEPVQPVPSFLSDEILQMEIVDRKQSSLATPDNAVYDMAILTEQGLSVAECSANADGDGGFGISDPDLVVEGGFNGFYYGDGMAALAGSSGISVFIDDSQLPERAMNFIRDADAAPLSIPGRANDVVRLGGGKQQTYKYVAASDDGLIAFNVQKKPYMDIDNVRSACIFSGMLVYIVQNGEHWELYVKDGDKDGDDAIKVASFPTETQIEYQFKADSYDSKKDFSRIVIGVTGQAFYIDRYYDGKTDIKIGSIKFKVSSSNYPNFVNATLVQKKDATTAVFATADGDLYYSVHSQLFNNATDNVVTATVTKIASVGRPLIHLDTMYLNDDPENETQVERVCAVYNNADGNGEIQIFPVKTATTSSFSFDKANISIKNVSGRIDKANFIGSFIYYQRGDVILYANLDDMSLTGYVYPSADELKLINDGILLFGTDAYTVQIVNDGPVQKLSHVALNIDGIYGSNITHVFSGVGFISDNTLRLYQGWEIKSTGRAELAGGADAVGYSPVKDTLFVASGGKIFYKSDVGEIDGSMFGEPAVDFEGETVQRFTTAGDVMVAVYEHRIVEFRHDGERWQAEPSVKFGGEQKLRGMVRTDYDDESNMFSEYKYLTDKGVVDSTIAEYHAVLAEQNVRNAGTIMSFDNKFFVFDSGRLYVMGDGTFDQVAVPLVAGARDIVLATGSPRYSGYIRKSSGSVYFQNGRAVTNIPFKAEGGVFNSLDEHFVGTDSGFVKLEYAETAHPRINGPAKKVVAGGALKYVCGYEASQHAMLVTESETGYLDYLKFDASGSYTNDVKERKATAWFAQNVEYSSRGMQAVIITSSKFWLYQNGLPYRDVTDLVLARNLPLQELNGIWKLGGAYYVAFGDGVMSFTGFRDGMQFAGVQGAAGKSFERIENIGNDMFVMKPEIAGGVFVYDMGSGIGYQAGFYDAIGSFGRYVEDGVSKYMISNGDRLLTSDNLRIWHECAKLPDEGAGPATAIAKTGRNQFVFATCKALYASKYQYETPRDTYMMTEQDAWRIYEDADGHVEAVLAGSVDGHLSAMHQSSSRAAEFAARATVQFDIGLTGDAEEPEEISSQAYDCVKKFYSGNTDNDADRAVRARMRSGFTSQSADDPAGWRELKCNWIARPYYSGVVDFDVCVHTTNTYYIPHISGAGNVGGDPELPRWRRNLVGRDVISSSCNSTIRDNYTTVEIGFLSNVFNVDDVMSMTVQGNSLPKKVFIDYANENGNVEGAAYEMYSSFAEPSLVDQGSIDLVKSEDGYRWFRFYCFGTDQQAFRMTAFDSKRNYDKDLYKIVFNSKDRPDAYGNTIVQQTLLEGDTVSLWPASRFIGQDEIFMGWTTSNYQGSAPDSNSELIPDGQVVDAEYIMMRSGGSRTLNLYAVWFSLDFDDESTVIGVESDGRPFGIARVEADPGALPQLGSRIAIKIGD